MNAEQEKRALDTIIRQGRVLRGFIYDEKRDRYDLHVNVAVSLRILLVDRYPVLLEYAKHKGVSLYVWGPYPEGYAPPANPNYKQAFWILAAAYDNPPDDLALHGLAHRMRITKYLANPLGQISDVEWYTATEVIKWVANKEGGAHLEEKPFRKLEQMKGLVTASGIVGFDKQISLSSETL